MQGTTALATIPTTTLGSLESTAKIVFMMVQVDHNQHIASKPLKEQSKNGTRCHTARDNRQIGKENEFYWAKPNQRGTHVKHWAECRV